MLGGGRASLGDGGEEIGGGGGGGGGVRGKKENSLLVCKCDRGNGELWPANAATRHLSSSLLLLPSNLQFRCMKYLVFLAI